MKGSKIHVGIFQLGFENVDLYAITKEAGGSCEMQPDNKNLSKIDVGISYQNWEDCVAVLLHETFELASMRTGLRFSPSGKLNHDTANFQFLMDHCQFGHICSMVSFFITPALPALAKVFEKEKKRRERKK